MIKEIEVKQGELVFFSEESAPMKLLVSNDRYAICSRKMSKTHDRDLLEHEVEMRAFFDIDEAFEYYKNDPVYTILDFKERIRGPHNLIFNPYDFQDENSMKELLNDLESGKTEISRRNKIELYIDINKTREINN